MIAKSIVQAIYCQDPPGRFVREDKKSGLWFDVGMKEAVKKTSQALRENVQEKKEGKNDKPHNEDDKPHNEDDKSETETDGSESEHEDSNQDRDASQKNTVNSLSCQDVSWARAVSYEDGDSSSEEEEEEDNDDKFSSQENDEYEGFNHVVFANLDILPKDDLHFECPLGQSMTGVPHPPAFTYGASDWTLKSFGSVFEDTVAGVPSPSALTFGTSNWTFKNVMVQEEPGVLILPALTSHASDWTFKSICSVFSDGAHSLTNDEEKAVDYA